MVYRLIRKGIIFCFFHFFFLTNVGYTATEEAQGHSSTNITSQQATSEGNTNSFAATDSSSLSISSGLPSGSGGLSSPLIVTPDLNTGAAVGSIPIEVAPGRKGIVPTLVLTYNSNRANGWIGVGWDIPIGHIQRNTKYGVNYGANDYVHVLNDASELMPRDDWGTNYYGAKIEGAFSKFYYNTSTGGWEVTTKEGTKYYYGTTTASRQDNIYGVFKWMLDKVQDTNGNYMTISYWKDQGDIYIDRIDYTGNGSLSPTNYVKFYYGEREKGSHLD